MPERENLSTVHHKFRVVQFYAHHVCFFEYFQCSIFAQRISLYRSISLFHCACGSSGLGFSSDSIRPGSVLQNSQQTRPNQDLNQNQRAMRPNPAQTGARFRPNTGQRAAQMTSFNTLNSKTDLNFNHYEHCIGCF